MGAILAAAISGLMPSLAKAENRPRVLVTGFGEWGAHTHNPTRDVIEALAADGMEAHVLPVSFTGSVEEFDHLYDRIKPEIVLCLGLAAATKGIRIETQAHNKLNVKLTDADGNHPAGVIDSSGTEKMIVTLPVHDLAQRLKNKNFPVEMSKDAGGFVCENILYHALRRASATDPQPMTGFIHIGYPKDAMSKVRQIEGIKLILSECERGLGCKPSPGPQRPEI